MKYKVKVTTSLGSSSVSNAGICSSQSFLTLKKRKAQAAASHGHKNKGLCPAAIWDHGDLHLHKLDSVEWDLRGFFTEVTFLPYKSVYLTTKVSDGLPEMHQQKVDPTESTFLNCT